MKKIFVITFSALLLTITASASVSIGDIERDSTGQIVTVVNYQQAVQYCQSHRSRLPTGREYEEYATDNGAGGIAETSYPNSPVFSAEIEQEYKQKTSRGYSMALRYRSDSQAHDKMRVDFYYNIAGYMNPAKTDCNGYNPVTGAYEDRAMASFWTATPMGPDTALLFSSCDARLFELQTGGTGRKTFASLRCIHQ